MRVSGAEQVCDARRRDPQVSWRDLKCPYPITARVSSGIYELAIPFSEEAGARKGISFVRPGEPQRD